MSDNNPKIKSMTLTYDIPNLYPTREDLMKQYYVEDAVVKLKELNDKLTSLLKEPEPGLITWVQATGKIVEEMADIVGYKGKKK